MIRALGQGFPVIGAEEVLAAILLEKMSGLLEHLSALLEEVGAILEELERILEKGWNGIKMEQILPVLELDKSLTVILLEQLNSLLEEAGRILED